LVECYEEAVRVIQADNKMLRPTDFEKSRALAIAGSALLAAGNFGRARELLTESYNLNPDESLAFAGAAMLDFYENRPKEGVKKLQQAIYLNPREPDFVFSLAQVAARAENYKDAADAYELFLQIAPRTDVDRRERIKGLIAFLRYLGSQKTLYNSGGKRQTQVASPIINNRPVIEVKLNGSSKPFKFVLDTGSGMSVISDTAAHRLGIKPIAKGGKARAVGGDGRFEIVYGFLSSLEIGEVRVSHVPVYIRKFYNAGNEVDGYIGLSVISKFITTLDYGRQTFALERLEENKKNQTEVVPPTSKLSIPLRTTSSGFLSSEVVVGGADVPLNFIVDTGASVSVISSDAVQQFQMNRFAETSLLRVFGAAGVTENVPMLNLPLVKLGENEQERISAAVLDLDIINEASGFEQSGILGGNFLRNYRLTFDFRRGKVDIEPTITRRTQKKPNDAVISEVLLKP
jgi:predicted aspartyl protease